MKISFFTIILDGMPFLKHLTEQLLPIAHEWFFIEGVAAPVKDTQHCSVPPSWAYEPSTFLSTDGTTEFLDNLQKKDHRIKVIREKR